MNSDPVKEGTQATRARVESALEGLGCRFEEMHGDVSIHAEPDRLHEVLTALKVHAGFDQATFVTAIDHSQDAAEPSGRSGRFELHHQLLSYDHKDRVRVHTRLVDADEPRATSCIDLWPGAAYMERECFDMFGIRFDGHEELKRLLMPEGYGHHPLRKDFPHQGIEPDRLYREWDAQRRASWSPEE